MNKNAAPRSYLLNINERGAIKRVFGVFIRAYHRWQRARITALELTELRNL